MVVPKTAQVPGETALEQFPNVVKPAFGFFFGTFESALQINVQSA